jgi:protein-disulfide isomerase
MKKETIILIAALLLVGGFFLLNKIQIPKNQPAGNQQPQALAPIEDLSATALPVNSKIESSKIEPLGNPAAPVKIFIFVDYQCPFCKKLFQESELQIRNEFVSKGLAVIYFKDYPFLGQESFLAGLAGRCANEQKKFWQYHDLLFEKQDVENSGVFSEKNLETFAAEIELDIKQFNSCLKSKKYKDAISRDIEEARKLGIQGTPYLLINNTALAGAHPYQTIRSLILKELQH